MTCKKKTTTKKLTLTYFWLSGLNVNKVTDTWSRKQTQVILLHYITSCKSCIFHFIAVLKKTQLSALPPPSAHSSSVRTYHPFQVIKSHVDNRKRQPFTHENFASLDYALRDHRVAKFVKSIRLAHNDRDQTRPSNTRPLINCCVKSS